METKTRTDPTKDATATLVPLDNVIISPLNVRRSKEKNALLQRLYKEFAIPEFAERLRDDVLLNPPSARKSDTQDGMYEVFAGQRRTLAYYYLREQEPDNSKWKTIPLRVLDVTEEEAHRLSLAENVDREDIDPFERAQAVQEHMKRFGYNQRQVAEKLNRSEQTVAEWLSILRLGAQVRAWVENGEIGRSAAVDLAQGFSDEREQELAAELIRNLNHKQSKRVLKALRDNPEWFSLSRAELRARAEEAAVGVPQDVRDRLEEAYKRMGFDPRIINWQRMSREDAMNALERYQEHLEKRRASTTLYDPKAATRKGNKQQGEREHMPAWIPSRQGAGHATLLEGAFPDDLYTPSSNATSSSTRAPSEQMRNVLANIEEVHVQLRYRDEEGGEQTMEFHMDAEHNGQERTYRAFLKHVAPTLLEQAKEAA